MDSAHCATDPFRLRPNQNDAEIQKLKAEMSKMKEDYERKIQVLTYEHQIKVVKFEKALSEKDNIIQTMKHEREIEKLKMAQKEFETKAKIEEKVEENDDKAKLMTLERYVEGLKKEIAKFERLDEKLTEMKNKFTERENKDAELETKIDYFDGKFNEMKSDLKKVENKSLEFEKEIKGNDGSIEKRLAELEKVAAANDEKKLVELETKQKDIYEGNDEKLTEMYYDKGKYFFVRKQMERQFGEILFASERQKFNGWAKYVVAVDEFCDDLWNKGKLFLLHPIDRSKALQLPHFSNPAPSHDRWHNDSLDNSFYHGFWNSVIIFGIIKE